MVDNHHCFRGSSSHDLRPKVSLFLHRPFELIHWVNIEIADVTLTFTLNTGLDIYITFESNNLLLENFDRLIQISFCQFNPLSIGVLLILFIKQNLGFFKHIYLVQDVFLQSSHFGTCLYVNFNNVFWIIRLKAGRSFLVLFFFLFYFFMLFILPFNRFFLFLNFFFRSLFFLFIRINLLLSVILRLFSLVIGLHIDVLIFCNRFFFIDDVRRFDQVARSKV